MKQVTTLHGVILENQDFFSNFNWFNFSCGDIVWMDDYTGQDFNDRLVAIFVKETVTIVTLVILSEIAGRRIAAKYPGVVSIDEVPGVIEQIARYQMSR